MARPASANARDAARAKKIEGQSIDWLDPNAKGETKGWLAPPTVGKSEYLNKPNPDGFRIDWEEKHHQMGLNTYERYTEGMSPQQKALVDERLASKGLYRGNTGLNRIDLPRRFHESSKHPGYLGAHQVTKSMGIDSKAELERIASLTPEQKLNELDSFVEKQVNHRRVGQQKRMEQFMLEPGNNPDTNVFGGNFSQQVLQDRNPTATTKQANALQVERGKASLQPGLQVSGGNVRIRPAQVVRAARGVSPMWASLPLGVTALGMSGQSALANPSAETIEDVGWDAANLVADAASLIPIPPVIAAAEGTQKLLGVAHQARLGQRALADQEGLPGPLEKIAKDPLNELEYAGKQVMNFFGDALRMGSEAGY